MALRRDPEAVQLLTGLDDLIAIGQLADGLSHGGREYRTYKSKELLAARTAFEQALTTARAILAPVQIDVASFQPVDTDDIQSRMAVFGKSLIESAAQLAQVVSTDLATGLDLSALKIQNHVITAVGNAKAEIASGIEGLERWRFFDTIALALDSEESEKLRTACISARKAGTEAARYLRIAASDPKFQLKAQAAKWHHEHIQGPFENCPLCERSLEDAKLVEQLEQLRTAGDAAAQSFDQNIIAILSRLEEALPETLRSVPLPATTPRDALIANIKTKFVLGENYSQCLVTVARIVEQAINSSPTNDLEDPAITESEEVLEKLERRIAHMERLIEIAGWFRTNALEWRLWWSELAGGVRANTADGIGSTTQNTSPKRELLFEHVERVSEALSKSEPYRKAAEAMRAAWAQGLIASALGKEAAKRTLIGDAIFPLKALVAASEAVARDAINGLSQRIAGLLSHTLLTEQLQFHQTQLSRKEGLIVHAGLSQELRIDATLVANTSWLRAVLWCFIFALREEAIEQLNSDPLPFMIFDDPQATFDVFHRARWAHYIANQQNGPAKLQIVLTTYDESFLDLILLDGITGRQALIGCAGSSCDHASLFEGSALARAWAEAEAIRTPAAAVLYLEKVRVYLEGLLKLMLRGEFPPASQVAVGSLRNLLETLHDGSKSPWDRPSFRTLIRTLAKASPTIGYIEGSHHDKGRNFGMGEAAIVAKYWKETLGPALERAFIVARHYRMLHGGMKALYAPPASVPLPEGYESVVRTIPLNVLGKAAALTNGRAADGSIDMTELATEKRLAIALGKHSAYRLSARTLEPVARPGDILLTKEYGEPSPKSLVVAMNEDRLLARRFEVSDNHTDIAVLTAQAINPREIAPPVVAHRATFALHKIIGVLFAHDELPPSTQDDHEVCDCGGASALKYLMAGALGLVEVDGQSAEPIALHKQFIIVRNAVSPEEALRILDGKPIIAEDGNGSHYFKRLRAHSGDQIILESLDSGGDFPPVTLSRPGKEGNSLIRAWPVSGVLFELPTN